MSFYLVEFEEQKNNKKIVVAFVSSIVAKSFPIGKTFSSSELLEEIKQGNKVSLESLNEKIKGLNQEAAMMKKHFGLSYAKNITEKALAKIKSEEQYTVTNSEEA